MYHYSKRKCIGQLMWAMRHREKKGGVNAKTIIT